MYAINIVLAQITGKFPESNFSRGLFHVKTKLNAATLVFVASLLSCQLDFLQTGNEALRDIFSLKRSQRKEQQRLRDSCLPETIRYDGFHSLIQKYHIQIISCVHTQIFPRMVHAGPKSTKHHCPLDGKGQGPCKKVKGVCHNHQTECKFHPKVWHVREPHPAMNERWRGEPCPNCYNAVKVGLFQYSGPLEASAEDRPRFGRVLK